MFIDRQITLMDNIIKMHGTVKTIHESLEKLYSITVINADYFFVFDLNEIGNKYVFKIKNKTPMPISGDILVAFSLDFYDMKPSAIIGNNILENSENYVFIFHEFVHCFQLENGEFDIRKELSVERQEMAKNNCSWELNYLFPYGNEYFINKTLELSKPITYENIVQYHKYMKAYLQETEYEYMIWQEWKEGFARYVENLVRNELGLKMNTTKLAPPFSRGTFYEIGSNYIEMLLKNNKEQNIVDIYNKMKLLIYYVNK